MNADDRPEVPGDRPAGSERSDALEVVPVEAVPDGAADERTIDDLSDYLDRGRSPTTPRSRSRPSTAGRSRRSSGCAPSPAR
ncbi:hypothetical protein [Rathayibacter sp. VKM Ac-2630]|uniref:hypothetical protein n=1 Tax=Rathayibacter sp. VKM Ac-2630 TaxID=1938617 RepID=UPI00111576BB|nr:hypothetical protein [Rathayibacter sp. VKM Ac-2630]